MAVIAERRLTKDQILELYLNEVYLGNRGSFAVHGLAEAARLYFGKDVLNLTLAEAATLAGMIQSPQALSPFRSPERCTERRNVVLQRDGARPASPIPAEAEQAAQGTAARLRPRARVRGAVLRRLRRAGADQPRHRHPPLVGRRLLDARPAPAAPGAGRAAHRPEADRRSAGAAAPQDRAGAGRADRRRSAHRRDPGDGRRPLLQPVAVQPRDRGAPAAGLGVQAVRVPGRLRAGARRRPHRSVAGDGRRRRADDVPLRRQGLRAGQLRRRVRRPDHAAPRPRPLAQHRHDQGGRDDRLRQGRRPVAAARRRHAAAALPVDRARRVRGDAARGGDRVHDLHQRRPGAAAARACSRCSSTATRSRRRRSPRARRSPGPRPPTSSRA